MEARQQVIKSLLFLGFIIRWGISELNRELVKTGLNYLVKSSHLSLLEAKFIKEGRRFSSILVSLLEIHDSFFIYRCDF